MKAKERFTTITQVIALTLAMAGANALAGDDKADSNAPKQVAQADQHQSHAAMSKDLPAGSRAVHDAMMKHMEMMNSMQMTGDTDKDFAMMMIHHHQQAIDMSRAQVKHGKDPELRRKAEEIIKASEKDIAELKKEAGMGQSPSR